MTAPLAHQVVPVFEASVCAFLALASSFFCPGPPGVFQHPSRFPQ
jgi:hypothetical protein